MRGLCYPVRLKYLPLQYYASYQQLWQVKCKCNAVFKLTCVAYPTPTAPFDTLLGGPPCKGFCATAPTYLSLPYGTGRYMCYKYMCPVFSMHNYPVLRVWSAAPHIRGRVDGSGVGVVRFVQKHSLAPVRPFTLDADFAHV